MYEFSLSSLDSHAGPHPLNFFKYHRIMFICSEAPGRPLNNLQDVDTVEESWGQHKETESEIEAREAEELRLAEEEYAAQELINIQVRRGGYNC
jgi:hypothetical protein